MRWDEGLDPKKKWVNESLLGLEDYGDLISKESVNRLLVIGNHTFQHLVDLGPKHKNTRKASGENIGNKPQQQQSPGYPNPQVTQVVLLFEGKDCKNMHHMDEISHQ